MYSLNEEISKQFDSFLERSFNEVSRPVFRDKEERDKALKVWWWVEVDKRNYAKKIQALRLALNDIQNIC